jgi:nanoRNase/pAp phosphatase (c-di-AMP/oligoRNAs hydrolase)
LLSNIKLYFGGHLAIASVSQKQLQKNNIENEVVSSLDVANMLKAVIGWDIAGTLIGGVDGRTKISLRTRDPNKYDLSKIALATGFGGGHKAAAGANIPGSLNKAQKILIESIAKLHPELGKP